MTTADASPSPATAPLADRTAAGRLLAQRLDDRRGTSPVLLALPDGGVTVAAPIARALGLPLSLAWDRSPLRPAHRRAASQRMRSAGYGSGTLFDFGGSSGRRGQELVSAELEALVSHADLHVDCPEVADRHVILVDDGLHSDQEVHATLCALRARAPASLTLATPFLTRAAADHHDSELDALVALRRLDSLGAAAEQYADPAPPALDAERALLG